MLTDNSLTFKHLGARLIFFTALLVRMLLYILLTTNCITLSSFLTNNLMRALWLVFICAFGGQTNVHVFLVMSGTVITVFVRLLHLCYVIL